MHNDKNSEMEVWDRETDLLVAGAGPAGMTAALVASIEGLDVVVCEKSSMVGGTGATSAGTLWIPGNRQNRDAGFEDTAAAAAKYLDSLIGGDSGFRDIYLRDGPEVIDYLTDNSDLQFVACGKHPDYRNNQPGAAVTGRAIVPEIFDARLLGRDASRVRPPIEGIYAVGRDDGFEGRHRATDQSLPLAW